MTNRTLFTIAAAAALIPAMPAMAQTMTAHDYIAKAGASDLYERTSSEMVMQSQNAGIRDFAKKMVTDHSKSTADVKHAAMVSHVHAGPPHLDADQQKMIADLKAASGADRDTLYVQQQKTAHQQALEVQQGYASDGHYPALRKAAAKIVPVVQMHIAMLDKM